MCIDINRLLSVASVIDLGKRDIQQQVAFGRERGWIVRYIHSRLASAEDCVGLIDTLNYRQSSSRFFSDARNDSECDNERTIA